MEISFWAIAVCGVVAMALGAAWYGPLFGKVWLEVIGADAHDLEARAAMQRRAMPLYVVQFILTLLQVWVLSWYVVSLDETAPVIHASMLWLGFVMPTLAAGAMWNNDGARVSWFRFGIQAGYQLLTFIIFGVILTMWG